MKPVENLGVLINPMPFMEGRETPHFKSRYHANHHVEDGEIVTLREWGAMRFYMVLPLNVWKRFQDRTSDPYGEYYVKVDGGN